MLCTPFVLGSEGFPKNSLGGPHQNSCVAWDAFLWRYDTACPRLRLLLPQTTTAKQISSTSGRPCPGTPRADRPAEVQVVTAILWGVDPLNTHSEAFTFGPWAPHTKAATSIRLLNRKCVVALPELACVLPVVGMELSSAGCPPFWDRGGPLSPYLEAYLIPDGTCGSSGCWVESAPQIEALSAWLSGGGSQGAWLLVSPALRSPRATSSGGHLSGSVSEQRWLRVLYAVLTLGSAKPRMPPSVELTSWPSYQGRPTQEPFRVTEGISQPDSVAWSF